MRSHQPSNRKLRPLAGAAAFVAVLLSAGGAGSQGPVPPPTGFEYAVKFICGAAIPAKGQPDPGVVAHGVYYTAINVHNPGKAIEFTKKIAIALPSERAGPVSKFFVVTLKNDEALEIDCPDILKHLEFKGPFVKGFVVIHSPTELDVVAVYTAAPSATGTVVTLELERVPARKY
jgi:hypothetical protein